MTFQSVPVRIQEWTKTNLRLEKTLASMWTVKKSGVDTTWVTCY